MKAGVAVESEAVGPASPEARSRWRATWRSRTRFAPVALLAGLIVGAATLIMAKGSGLIFFYDEWAWVMRRRGWSVGTFLEPHNEHLSLLPVTVFKLLFVTVGLSDYWVYRLVGVAFHVTCVILLFLLVRRRVGDWLGVLLVTPVLFLGAAWNDLLAPFQIGFLGSVAAGLGMLLVIERGDRRGDLAACLLIGLALASSGLGIPVAVAALVELLRRRSPIRSLSIAAAPLVLYGAWYLVYGHSEFIGSNIPRVPVYTASAAAGAAGALVGLGLEWGQPLIVLLFGLALIRLRVQPPSPRLTSVTAAAFVFWGLTGLARAQLNDPAASRYLYPGAVLMILMVAELCRGVQISPPAYAAIGVLVAASVLSNYGALRDGSAYLHDWSSYVRAELGALQIAGSSVDPSYQPDPVRAPDIHAGQYLEAIRGLGPAGDSPAQLGREGEPQRQTADQVLARALGVGLRPSAAPPRGTSPPPNVDRAVNVTTSKRGSCLRFHPAGAGAALDLPLPPDGLLVAPEGAAGIPFSARYVADGFTPTPLGTIQGMRPQLLQIGTRRTAVAWHLELLPTEPLRVCTVAPA